MADDSKNKAYRWYNPRRWFEGMDFRSVVGVFVFLGLALIVLAFGYGSYQSIGHSEKEEGSSEKSSIAAQSIRHVVYSIAPAMLTHWNDANFDGKVQGIETRQINLPVGCYRFRAKPTNTKLDHDGPTGPYHELGSILLLNGKLWNEPFRLNKSGPVHVSFYPFGTSEYPKVEGPLGFQLMHLTVYPVNCPK